MPAPDPKLVDELRASGQFDAEWYRRTYRDVDMLGMDPAEHYLTYGKALGRAGSGPGQAAAGRESSAPPPLQPVPRVPEHRHSVVAPPDAPDAQKFANDSLKAYAGPKQLPPGVALPLVSVVMTAYNAQDTIEAAVLSLLHQSWPNLEVVVCDDRSSDRTWEILCSLRRRHPRALKIIRLERNSGTFLAKNVAIAVSSGDYILFQDSDDFSHPERVTVSVLPLLSKSDAVASRTKYCRFDQDNGRIVPIGGLNSKYGLITLAVRRIVFREIGYFDAVRKAGDDEWFERLRHLYGKASVLNLDVTLYLAALRSNSLIADSLRFNEDGSIDQSISSDRDEYVKIFQSRFRDPGKTQQWYRSAFPIYPKRPVETYPASIAALPSDRAPIFAAVCSIPARTDQLQRVVARILPQVDHLHVYLDKYPEVPDFLGNNASISVTRSEDVDRDFRDNAKFLAYDRIRSKIPAFYYVTCDDDLDYPRDYVAALIDRIEAYDRRAIVGLHGVVCEEHPTGYFRRRFIYHFQHAALPTARLVNILGTGTVAFHSSLFKSIDPRTWPRGGMVDIFLAIEARKRRIPMVCVDRHEGWLREQKMPEANPTLYDEFSKKDEAIVEQLSKQAPWGYRGILDAVAAQPDETRRKLEALLPVFPESISVQDFFSRLR